MRKSIIYSAEGEYEPKRMEKKKNALLKVLAKKDFVLYVLNEKEVPYKKSVSIPFIKTKSMTEEL